jgi:hypothetical protein
MSMMRTAAAMGLMLSAQAAVLVPAANAQANCETYGKLALQQQKENESNKCGFSGPEWSSDLKAHVAWCSGVGPDEWKVQLKNREQELAACKSK